MSADPGSLGQWFIRKVFAPEALRTLAGGGTTGNVRPHIRAPGGAPDQTRMKIYHLRIVEYDEKFLW